MIIETTLARTWAGRRRLTRITVPPMLSTLNAVMSIHMCILCTALRTQTMTNLFRFLRKTQTSAIQAVYKELTLTPEEKQARHERSEKLKKEIRERLRKEGITK